MSSPYLKICNGPCPDQPEDPATTFPYELDDFQKHAVMSISRDENVLVTAPTGAGKTCVCIYAMANSLRKGKKVIYTSPIKSLSNQKFKEFKDHPEISNVGILTGDIKFNPDADCLIMTTEILRNLLYHDGETSEEATQAPDGQPKLNIDLTEIDCVIFDEVHYINDRARGKVWEETIVMLPPRITLVMLSATIDSPDRFASWIGDLKKEPINLVSTSYRPVPLRHWLYVESERHNENSGKLYEIMSEKNKFMDSGFDEGFQAFRNKFKDPLTGRPIKLKGRSNQDTNILMGHMKVEAHELNGFLKFLKQRSLFPALIFVFSRKNCENWGASIHISVVSEEEQVQINKIFNHYMAPYMKQYEHMGQFQSIKNLLQKGIGVHHSGLIPILKEIIEILFSKGLIKILFCTETFAVGVNMPTKTVVFTEMEKFDGELGRRRLLKTDEYLQMAGRAGRRGLDKIGTVVHFPIRELPSKLELKGSMTGSNPSINSKFSLNYQFLLKVIGSPNHNLLNFIRSSLLNEEQNRQINLEQKQLDTLLNQSPSQKLESISQDLQNRVNDYLEIEELLNSGLTFKPKQKKQYKKKLADLSNNDSPEFRSAYALITAADTKEEDIESLRKLIDQLENQSLQDLCHIINFLQHFGFLSKSLEIQCTEKFFNDLNQSDLELKGLIGAQISECNEILLTEIVTQGFFQDLNIAEIAGILAIFIEEKIDDESQRLKSVSGISSRCKSRLYDIVELADHLSQTESELGITTLDTDWNIYVDFILPAYMWANGESIAHIYKVTNIYEGNFIKNILKISHIAETLVTVAEMLGDTTLAKKAETLSKDSIRDEVTVNSLYIN